MIRSPRLFVFLALFAPVLTVLVFAALTTLTCYLTGAQPCPV